MPATIVKSTKRRGRAGKVYRQGPNWCACTSVTTVKPAWRPLRLFATLTVMGIEAQHRPAAYRAIIKENLNPADDKQLSARLTANGIDEAAYQQARESERVKSCWRI